MCSKTQHRQPHVLTVDASQGDEFGSVVVSVGRKHGLGFVRDRQRLCVALSRAKRRLIFYGRNGYALTIAALAEAINQGVFDPVDQWDFIGVGARENTHQCPFIKHPQVCVQFHQNIMDPVLEQ